MRDTDEEGEGIGFENPDDAPNKPYWSLLELEKKLSRIVGCTNLQNKQL